MAELQYNKTKKGLALPPEESDITHNHKPLRDLIQKALERYFAHMHSDMPPREVYQLVIAETEIPLLKTTLAYAEGNQCQAAEILGISRSTLRKKLQQHKLTAVLREQ